MATTSETQIQTLHTKTKKPFIPLQVYNRKTRSKFAIHLPEELVIEILKRLPVTSLLKFMCVCKSWYNLITSPSFISYHLSHQSSLDCCTTLYSVDFQFYLYNIDDPLDSWCKIESPVSFMSLIVGCCDGLICLYDDWCEGTEPLILWNPSIRKAFSLPLPVPPPPFRGPNWGSRSEEMLNFSLGFGFDVVSKEYKVVRVLCRFEMEKRVSYFHGDVCSLSQGGWRSVGFGVQGGEYAVDHRGVYVNGVVHWICKKRLANNVTAKTVVAFNLGSEEFTELALPNPLSSTVLFSIKLSEVKLAVSCSCDASNVWVMEEYGVETSWRKLLDFHLGDNVGPVLGASVGGDGKIVVTTAAGNWISWDPSNQILKNLALPVLEPDYVDNYVHTLVFIRFKNRALRCRELQLSKKKVRRRFTAPKYRSYMRMLRIMSEVYRN